MEGGEERVLITITKYSASMSVLHKRTYNRLLGGLSHRRVTARINAFRASSGYMVECRVESTGGVCLNIWREEPTGLFKKAVALLRQVIGHLLGSI